MSSETIIKICKNCKREFEGFMIPGAHRRKCARPPNAVTCSKNCSKVYIHNKCRKALYSKPATPGQLLIAH